MNIDYDDCGMTGVAARRLQSVVVKEHNMDTNRYDAPYDNCDHCGVVPNEAGECACGDDREDEIVGDNDLPECGLCGGPLVLLGVLGRLQHFRCRNCGMDYSQDVSRAT